MTIIRTAALTLSALAFSGSALAQNYSYNSGYNAHEACKKSENKQKLIGGGIGAIAGAVIGSQVSGNGARTEGSAIGAVIGGLAGGGIADKRIDCDPVYNTQTQTRYLQPSYRQPAYSQQTYSQPVHSSNSQNRIVYVQQAPSTASTPYRSVPPQTQYYPVRTTYSNHPVYSNPSYGHQTSQTYVAPSYTENHINRVIPHSAPNTNKEYYRVNQTGQSNVKYVQSRNTVHYHGRYECNSAH